MSSPETDVGASTPPFDEINEVTSDGSSTVAVYQIWKDIPFLILNLRMLLTALILIYAGAHAALKRPHSAAPVQTTHNGKVKKLHGDTYLQGMMLSDAIMFPVMAACVLIGLYYLIQWMNNPALLNKILRGYMSCVGVASMAAFFSHVIQLIWSFVFPDVYRRLDQIYWVDGSSDQIWRVISNGDRILVEGRRFNHPLPLGIGPLECLWIDKSLWNLRFFIRGEWDVKFRAAGIIKERIRFRTHSLCGFLVAIPVMGYYFWTSSPTLANVAGFAFCYGTFLILSPTSFGIGTVVLVGLFAYDIVMVFYTPYMITVATTIDAPIKLTFTSAARISILGLGDIVLPGLVMALALRYDLWRFYQRQIKKVKTELVTETQDPKTGKTNTSTQTTSVEKKVPYFDIKGQWANRFWISSLLVLFFSTPGDDAPLVVRNSAFPKTYFYASVIGYTVGMILTLTMLVIYQHGQPALLYLVPCVLGALWLTAAARGELKEMWAFTEDGSLDKQDVIVETDGEGNVLREIPFPKDDDKDNDKNDDKDKEKAKDDKDKEDNGKEDDGKEKAEKDGKENDGKEEAEKDGKKDDGKDGPKQVFKEDGWVDAAEDGKETGSSESEGTNATDPKPKASKARRVVTKFGTELFLLAIRAPIRRRKDAVKQD